MVTNVAVQAEKFNKMNSGWLNIYLVINIGAELANLYCLKGQIK